MGYTDELNEDIMVPQSLKPVRICGSTNLFCSPVNTIFLFWSWLRRGEWGSFRDFAFAAAGLIELVKEP